MTKGLRESEQKMKTKKIDVKTIIAQKRAIIAEQVSFLQNEYQITPTFKVILVGEDPASLSYIKGKMKAAEIAGMNAEVLQFPESTSEAELLLAIQNLNEDGSVHGFIVQLPLPQHIDENKILQAVTVMKDIDGFHPENLGRLVLGLPGFISCTPKGIMEILQAINVELKGKEVVVIGRSNIVGKPVAMLALQHDATVTICHSQTKNLSQITSMADILIVAIGRAEFITKEYIKKNAIVIDVGVNKSPTTGKLVGDVNYDAVKEQVSMITPVPGGVGPMTITMLLQNVLEATCMQNNIQL